MSKVPFLIFIALLVLTSCGAKSDNHDDASSAQEKIVLSMSDAAELDSLVNRLLDASAKDFFDHQVPAPAGFRNVQVKALDGTEGQRNYLICGQFLSLGNEGKDQWIPFATIKTGDYEQWIGNNAQSYSQEAKLVDYHISDLSVTLKEKFDLVRSIQ